MLPTFDLDALTSHKPLVVQLHSAKARVEDRTAFFPLDSAASARPIQDHISLTLRVFRGPHMRPFFYARQVAPNRCCSASAAERANHLR
jgi:hypothetical protein